MDLNARAVFATILVIIVIAGAIMNLLVLLVIYKNKTIRHHIASVFIANLAMIDLLNLLFVMPFSIQTVVKNEWVYGNTMCQINGLFGTLFSLASILTLAVISLDRWAAVMKPLAYRARMIPMYAVYLTIYVWIQASVFALVPACANWFDVNLRYYSCTFPSESRSASYLAYMSTSFVCNIGISLLIMLFTYFCVFRVARSHSRRIAVAVVSVFASEHRKIRKETVRQREARTAIKISFVIGAFLICYLPYSVVRVMELVPPTNLTLDAPPVFFLSVQWTVYLKSAINPFIYSLLQTRFRKALSELFRPSQRGSNINFNVAHMNSRNRILRESQSLQYTNATYTTAGADVFMVTR